MEKIEKLKPEQEKLMDEISKEYEDMVLGGDDSHDPEEIKKGINFIYSIAHFKEPKIVVCQSPQQMAKKAGLKSGETIDYLGCGYDSGWTAFYDFFERIGVEYDKECRFTEWKNFITKSGVFATILYEEVAFVCIRPCLVKRTESGDLHCVDGPAISWQDGYSLWSLNGVIVPQYLVETPEGQLSIDFFMNEKNADVKAEFIRKYGVDRMLSLGKKICDAKNHSNDWFVKSEYELWNMGDIFNINYAPFLKMRNLTTGIYHLEGVGPECKTIEDALEYRANGRKINLENIK